MKKIYARVKELEELIEHKIKETILVPTTLAELEYLYTLNVAIVEMVEHGKCNSEATRRLLCRVRL